MAGKQHWYFPDAELPPAGTGELAGHESVIVLNPNPQQAVIEGTLWYVDREPARFSFEVAAERVRCLRTNQPDDLGGHIVRLEEQYAISLRSSVPVIAQYGRLDVRQPNLAFYTTGGYSE
jgi:hypothetical protein